jgi:hypothetical protein
MSIQSQISAAYKTKVEGSVEKGVRIMGLQVMRNIVQNTPVDTGRARNNYNVDLNTVDGTITDETDKNTDGTEKFLSATLGYKLSDVLYISNNLPYIKKLNEGWSKQAPAAFVDKAIMVGIRQAKQLIKRGGA